ncbi:hypothetical protein RHSIM_Rhsim09G0080500 [Rhododendron simsii]|uniref:HAT C-terminal dimerisation domain-containing protein n=1 Tax=Rhododendron simsii TaxID=118357 RepID=A0A834LBG1_RHOSS|nr:hypothetical protein RHSIM_Rhsim09G0080500 [Rhododendron simsii]
MLPRGIPPTEVATTSAGSSLVPHLHQNLLDNGSEISNHEHEMDDMDDDILNEGVEFDITQNAELMMIACLKLITSDTLGRMVEECLLDWGIDKFLTVTVDNASSNNVLIKYLERKTKDRKTTILNHEFLHVRCLAHILNLIVREGLQEIDVSIARVRNMKLNSSKYPIVSQMAQDVLAIAVSAVASESAFSTGGRVIDPYESFKLL